MTDAGLAHPPGATIQFAVKTSPDNHGVILRRRLDQATFGQRAEVLVNGASAGIWLTPGDNTSKRWVDSDFTIPASLTAGKSRLAIELRVLPSDGVPQGIAEGWTDFRYLVYSITR